MIVAGVMSGTSADGVDVTLVRLTGRRFRTRFELISHRAFPYPSAVREAVLAAMNARSIAVSELARLNFLLAEIYAGCVRQTVAQAGVPCELVGCHGQTIYHQGKPAKYLGRNIACTWQIGDGSVLATRLGIPVVSDFRPADMAAGGLGAPLVPFLDFLVFRHPRRGRIVQNIGGIGNLTAIPAAARAEQVRAFYQATLPQLGWQDTGNMTFRRDNEGLRLVFETGPTLLTVHFKLAPIFLPSDRNPAHGL